MMDRVPAVEVTGADGPIALDRVATPLVVYFYPKDDTSGCTREAQDFSALADRFADAGVKVIGVSKDSVASHAKFTSKYSLTVELVSDESGAACAEFGVWVEKSMYGRKYMGVDRATFLFDAEGRLVAEWRKVKVSGHAQVVLDKVTEKLTAPRV